MKVSVMAIIGILALVAVFAPYWWYSEKNPQLTCINDQNEGFAGNEQKGDAYKFNKDTCQELSK